MKIFVLTIAYFISKFVIAQDCEDFLLLKNGMEYEYLYYNEKNKLEFSNKIKVLDVNRNEKTWIAKTEVVSFDAKDKEIYNWHQEYICEEGILSFDLSNLLDKNMLSEYKDIEVKIVSDKLELPSKLIIGQKLNEGSATISVNKEGTNIFNITMGVSNRIVEAKEKITVPVGTFDCFVISYDVNTKTIFKTQGKNKEWHAKSVGMVKQESYDSKGNLIGYSILNKFKK